MSEATGPLAGRTIVLGVTGSIAAYKAVEVASRMVQAGATVRTVMTRAATEFVGPATFRGVTGHEPLVDIWAPDGEHAEPHVALGRSADLMLITPATASVMGRLAHGISDDCVTLAALAMRGPLLVAPAMDAGMWANAATQANVRTLQERGVAFLGPLEGRLASGEIGAGRLMEPMAIVDHIKAAAGRLDGALAGARVVVTAGGTREPVDPVRFVGNRSSGRMGHALARAAWRRGARVTLVSGPTHLARPPGVRRTRVATAREMLDAVAEAIPRADVVIFAAAVADYRPARARSGKIKRSREGASLSVELTANPDVALDTMPLRKPGARVVGFALETDDLLGRARSKMERKAFDLVVANHARGPGGGPFGERNAVTLLAPDGPPEPLPLMPKDEIAEAVLDRLDGAPAPRFSKASS